MGQRTTLTTVVHVPEEIVDEARTELAESDEYDDIEDYILDRIRIKMTY